MTALDDHAGTPKSRPGRTATSAAPQAKIFGVRLGVDPKILVAGLVLVAAILFWYNSRSDEETAVGITAPRRRAGAPRPARSYITTPIRRQTLANDRGTLRLRPIDLTRSDVNPALRLDLLARLQSVQPPAEGRNLFEMAPPPLTQEDKALLEHPPNLLPKPLPPPVTPEVMPIPRVDIPLKYYGFTKPIDKGPSNRGFFLDGDNNVVVASEGAIVNKRYLVVELTNRSARLEDVQLKQGQTLPVDQIGTQ